MMSLRDQVNLLVGLGYKRLAAQAKVAHDAASVQKMMFWTRCSARFRLEGTCQSSVLLA